MTENEYDPLEKLSLLAPHAIDLRHIPSDYQRLTPADVAARLAKVSKGASLLGRVKVAGEVSLLRDLVFWLQVQIAGTVIKPGSNKERALIQPMALLAITEVVHPRICGWCKGNGAFPELDEKGAETGRKKVCEACHGGRYAYSERRRARECNIHPEDWRRKYSAVYLEVLTIPWTWEGEVRDALK